MISSDIKLLAVYDKLEKQIKALQLKHGVDGAAGADGVSIKGDQGDRGHDGVGHDGKQGAKGVKGDDGAEGSDGVSITDASIDFDNHLVIKLSDGTEIDAGELQGGLGGDKYYRSGSTVNIDSKGDVLNNPVFTYTAGVLTLITYGNGTTKQFTYTDGVLTQVVQTSTSGVITTKTLTYLAGVLASISTS